MALSSVAVYAAMGWQSSSVEVFPGGCFISGGEGAGVFFVLRLRDVTSVQSAIFLSAS